MSSKKTPKIILGTHTVGDSVQNAGIAHFDKIEDVKALLDAFQSRGYKEIDSAQNYPGSEARLGEAGAASRFIIHTKVKSGAPGAHEASKLASNIQRSLDDLKTQAVETMFLHLPDRETPFEDTARVMNDAIKQGKFKHFGVSNYTAEDLQKFIDIGEQNNYAKPSVYQGHYNAIVRGAEEELFPLLRKHQIAFFAYSAAAGGLFSNNKSTTKRWTPDNVIGSIYSKIYSDPKIQEAVSKVQADSEKHGISGHAVAMRWAIYHSILDGQYGDAVLFTVSKMSQLTDTLDAIEAGPLPAELADEVTAVYATVQGAGPGYYAVFN